MKNLKTKILFIIPSLRPGGAERVISFIAQSISKQDFDSILVVIGSEKDASYNVSGIEIIYLNEQRVSRAIPKLYSVIKKNRPKIVVSAMGHVNIIMALMSLIFRKVRFIGREVNVHSVLKDHLDRKSIFGYELLTKICYRFLDVIICQSQDMKHDLHNNLGIPVKNLVVINNPISSKFKPKIKRTDNGISAIELITVGRLAKQKGHLRILKVLARISLPFHYTIIGDGPEKSIIMEKAYELGLTEKITHIPFTSEISMYLEKSSIFLQGSYVEGFPNALLESCAVGTPVLAFKALGGIDEIIEVGVNGFIAEDETDFINKLNSMAAIDWDPLKVSESVTRKFNSKKIVNDYENLFLSFNIK